MPLSFCALTAISSTALFTSSSAASPTCYPAFVPLLKQVTLKFLTLASSPMCYLAFVTSSQLASLVSVASLRPLHTLDNILGTQSCSLFLQLFKVYKLLKIVVSCIITITNIKEGLDLYYFFSKWNFEKVIWSLKESF